MTMNEESSRPSEEKLVERLVRLADPGPEVPADGASRIKATIRPLWIDEVRARRIKRYALWGGGTALAAAAAIALLVNSPLFDAPTPVRPIGEIERLQGTTVQLQLGDDEARSPSMLDRIVLEGSSLSTGAGSLVALRLTGGVSLRLDEETSLRLISPRVVFLDRGAIYADSNGTARDLEVHSDFGIARDIGTRFQVRREKTALTIRVRDGKVALRTGGQEVAIGSGMQLVVEADGSRRLSSIEAHAGAWDWIYRVSPPFPIEGRTVSSFLTWVSRESGLEIQYEDPRSEQIAATTILHGVLGDVTPAEAATVVLPSAGLAATRSDDGALRVRILKMKARRE